MDLDLTNFCVMQILGSSTDSGHLGKGFKKDPSWGEDGRAKREDSGHAKSCVVTKWLMEEEWVLEDARLGGGGAT